MDLKQEPELSPWRGVSWRSITYRSGCYEYEQKWAAYTMTHQWPWLAAVVFMAMLEEFSSGHYASIEYRIWKELVFTLKRQYINLSMNG